MDELNLKFKPGHLAALRSCTGYEQGLFAGNSIHSHVAAALTVWGLCSVAPRAVLEPLHAHPSLPAAEVDVGAPPYAVPPPQLDPDAVDGLAATPDNDDNGGEDDGENGDQMGDVEGAKVLCLCLQLRVLIFVFSDFVFVMHI